MIRNFVPWILTLTNTNCYNTAPMNRANTITKLAWATYAH
jgi:hypothetical protein